MNPNILRIAALTTALLLHAGFSGAAGQTGTADAAKAKASAVAAPSKKAPAARPIDINSASRAELMKLPGITQADANKIIGERPYLSKAELVTRGIISVEAYHGLKAQIFARQKGTRKPGG